MRRTLRAGGLALLALVVLIGASSCHSREETPGAPQSKTPSTAQTAPSPAAQPGPSSIPKPLVVIGVDGLEWRLALEMMRNQALPEIGGLMRDGGFARLTTLEPAVSPPIWTSMATGVTPDRHGISGFVRPGLRGPSGSPLLFTNRERRVKAIWNIASDAGLRSCVVGYWMTFPVEEIAGVMVAQTGTPPGETLDAPDEHATTAPTRKGGLVPGKSGQVHPPELEGHVFALAEAAKQTASEREVEIFGDTSEWPTSMKRLVEHSRWSLAADSAYQRIALDLLGDPNRCDLLLVYLGIPDVLGHRFWRWTYPGDFANSPSDEEVARYGNVLRKAYRQVDAFVGAMRRAAGKNATVVVASDHGMGPFRPKSRVDLSRDGGSLIRTGGHSARRDSMVVAAGPGIARQADSSTNTAVPRLTDIRRSGSILDTTPTLLALLGIPSGADMDGQPLTALLDPAFLIANPPQSIPSHTPAEWASSRKLAGGEDLHSAERLEQLRGLGYLE